MKLTSYTATEGRERVSEEHILNCNSEKHYQKSKHSIPTIKLHPKTSGFSPTLSQSPRAVLDMVMKRKIPSPRRESNPITPIVQPVIV